MGLAQVLFPRKLRDAAAEAPQFEETSTMLADAVREWTAAWVEEGREQGREEGHREGYARERALLCRQAARKFDAAAGERLAALIADVADEDRLAEIGDCIIECATTADFFDRLDRFDIRMDSFDARLRSIEVTVGKMDQRLLLIERVVLPAPTPEPPAEEQ